MDNPAPTISTHPQDQPAAVMSPPVFGRNRVMASMAAVQERLGAPFILMLVWLFFEFVHPPRNPLKIPTLIGLASFLMWVTRRNKQWVGQAWAFVVILAAMVAGIPTAESAGWAVHFTSDQAFLYIAICIPLLSVLTTVRKLRIWIYTLIVVCVYVGIWSMLHDGYGPAGADGAQDENYVAAIMGMAIPFAYFSLFTEKRFLYRLVLVASIFVYCGAMVIQENPSRGGFLGLCAVALYCLWRSPRKLLGFSVLGVGGLAVALLAGPSYWKEISDSTDYQSGTGNMRLELWQIGFRMWKANPVLGVGPGQFTWNLGTYQSAAQVQKFERVLTGSIVAHSLPVECLSELGLVGVIALVVLVSRTWRGMGKMYRVPVPPGPSQLNRDMIALRCYTDAARASILAVLVNGIFLSLLYYSDLYLVIILGCAIPQVYRSQILARTGGGPAPLPAWPRRMAMNRGVG